MTCVIGRFFYGENMFQINSINGKSIQGFVRQVLKKQLIESKLLKLGTGLFLAATMVLGGVAYALDINNASQESLQSIKGVGPTRAKLIIEEREKNGAFKNAEDLSQRVRGIGEKTVSKMTEGGLTFESNGEPSKSKGEGSKSNKGSRSRTLTRETGVAGK